MINTKYLILILLALLSALAACGGTRATPGATPTVDPAIYNQVPKTTHFEAGQCTAVLSSATPAYTSNTLGGQPSGEIPAGSYEVAFAADYGSSVWYALNGVQGANFIPSTSAASTEGDCQLASS